MKNSDFSIFSIISSADFFSKFILLVLICSSIVSWAFIIERIIAFRKVQKTMHKFDKNFWISNSLEAVYRQSKLFDSNPLSLILIQAMEEWKKSENISSPVILTGAKERILNSMNFIKSIEVAKLEKYLYVLALIGSKSPFVGLMGTVWGIMNSFQAIAISKNTSLNIVAPGVAEALMVTAVGLLVAIPALIFYNFFFAKTNQIDIEIDYFIGRTYNLFSKLLDDKFSQNQF
jgi:biopolymer transport protein TolQ